MAQGIFFRRLGPRLKGREADFTGKVGAQPMISLRVRCGAWDQALFRAEPGLSSCGYGPSGRDRLDFSGSALGVRLKAGRRALEKCP